MGREYVDPLYVNHSPSSASSSLLHYICAVYLRRCLMSKLGYSARRLHGSRIGVDRKKGTPHQVELMRRVPCFSQQDFVIYKIIFKVGHLGNNVDNEGHPPSNNYPKLFFRRPLLVSRRSDVCCGCSAEWEISPASMRIDPVGSLYQVYEILRLATDYVFSVG